MWCTPVHREVSFSSEPLYEISRDVGTMEEIRCKPLFMYSIHYHRLLQITLSNALPMREYERKDLLVVSLQVSFMKSHFLERSLQATDVWFWLFAPGGVSVNFEKENKPIN